MASTSKMTAIFVEPVQGEGGDVIPPAGYLQALRDLCDRHGILLVFDEIQSGVGRTGKMFAAEHWGVEPDVLLVGKGLGSGMPIGAIVAKESVMKWETGSHGSTYGGNPVCCAAALATLDIVERELLPNVRKMGERLMAGLKVLAAKHSSIGDVRGLGLMIGIEFVKDRKTREHAGPLVHELVQRAFRKGLLLLSAGRSVIRIAPMDAMARERDARVDARTACLASAPLETRLIRPSHASAAAMAELLRARLTPRGSVSVDERTNTVIVRDVECP